MGASERMWEGKGGSEQLKEMGRTRRTLAPGDRVGSEEQGLPLGATQSLVEGRESQRWSRSERHSPLLSFFFWTESKPEHLQLRPTCMVLAKLV